MNPIELQNAFEIEMNRRDSDITLSSDKVFYFINEAAEDFVRDRIKGLGPEANQETIDDLRTMLASITITPIASGIKPNSVFASLPSNYYYTLEEEAEITFGSTTKRVGITETTYDTYRSKIDDPYSEHNLQYNTAEPLRLFENEQVLLVGDGNYTIDKYFLRYLKLPNKVDLNAYMANHDDGLLDLPEHTHSDIVKMAVRMAIENQTDIRYQSYINETNNI